MTPRRFAATSFVLLLAATLAADEMPTTPAMSRYQLGLLRKGPAWTATRTPATDSIQAGHMANINRMAREGLLLAAGPMGNQGDLRGIFIFRDDSIARVRELAGRDPAIQSRRLVLDLFEWLAPAGIGEPYKRMAAQPGHRDSMVRLQLVLLKAGPQPSSAADASRAVETALARGIASGELATGGPVSGDGDLRGVLVYRGDSTFAHRRALEDPAVRSGRLTVEMIPWWTGYGTMPGDTLGLRPRHGSP